MAHEILLDSGTNEVEILEFFLGDQSFGINVAKVLQIVAFDESLVTHLPDDSKAVIGVLRWRDRTIPLIDLNAALSRKPQATPDHPLVLVTRFNDATNGFLVSSVNRIHRINWDQITPPSTLISKYSSNVTGSVNLEGKDILLVDFEYIVAELFPATKMDHNLELSDIHKELAREDAKLIFAEDSAFIRNSVCTLLKQVGYNHVATFENGAAAFDYFTSLVQKAEREAKPLSDFVNLVITDIEMPKMDGLTLCRRIKQELNISTVPVALFSSLIDEQMVEKCKEVGADIYATKPKIGELVLLIDGILRVKK